MTPLRCPFHAECSFHSEPAKTPSDVFLRQLYCQTAGYAACEISKSILKGEPVVVGANPSGNAR